MNTEDHKAIHGLHGDVLDMLPTLDAESVHAVMTSPPYYGLRDYKLQPTDWPAVTYAPMAGLAPIEVKAWTGCLGLEPTVEAYVGHLVHVFRLLWRVLRDDGTAWLNLGDSYTGRASTGGPGKETAYTGQSPLPSKQGCLKPKDLILVPHRVALALQADGWYLRQDIVWAKGLSFCEHYAGSVMPESVRDRTTRAHEYVFMLAKQARYYYDHIAVKEVSIYPDDLRKPYAPGQVDARGNGHDRAGGTVNSENRSGRNLRSVWCINTKSLKAAHFAVWPDTLVAPMIKASTSERGVCAACGAPWERVVERYAEENNENEGAAQALRCSGAISGGTERVTLGKTDKVTTQTTGWRKTCTCDTDAVVPATILDPFGGVFTTAKAAKALHRRSIIIEKSADYVRLGRERTAQGNLFVSTNANPGNSYVPYR